MTINVNGSLSYEAALQAAMDESREAATQELQIRNRRDSSSSSSSSSSSALSVRRPSGILQRMEQYQEVLPQRLVRILQDSMQLIERGNQRHAANAPAAIVIQSIWDMNGSMEKRTWLTQLEQLTKTYYVALQIMGSHDTLGATIREMQNEVAGHPIMTAIIKAHGDSNNILFGKNYNRPVASDFAPLDPSASIIFEACMAGQKLARRVAAVQPRQVFASIDETSDAVITSCCAEHGCGLISFMDRKGENTMVARRFERKNATVMESYPCSATPSRIQEIRAKLFQEKYALATISNDRFSQCRLGTEYFYGIGVTKSEETGLLWLKESAGGGMPLAQLKLAELYRDGNGVPRSIATSLKWFKKAITTIFNDPAPEYCAHYFEERITPFIERMQTILPSLDADTRIVYNDVRDYSLMEVQRMLPRLQRLQPTLFSDESLPNINEAM